MLYLTAPAYKDVLLCLHGFPTSSHDYHKVWAALSERFSLVAFDMLGYGFSAKPTQTNYTTALQADVLEAVISSLGVLAMDFVLTALMFSTP